MFYPPVDISTGHSADISSPIQCQEFAEVFNLCVEVLEKADKPSLIKATLDAMLRFLNWIPLGYIFETAVIDHLVSRVCCPLYLDADLC